MQNETTIEIDGAKLTVSTEALFKAWLQQQVVPAAAAASSSLPPLNEGETYLFGISTGDGKTCHTILLPGDNDDANWQAQMDWAKFIGGDLPNRIEQAYLNAHHADLFKKEAYWSNQLNGDGWAWCQSFYGGSQINDHTDYALRARAVRRLII